VVRRGDELRELAESLTPHSTDVTKIIEEIGLQLFVIGFEVKRMRSQEWEVRMGYVEQAMDWLRQS